MKYIAGKGWIDEAKHEVEAPIVPESFAKLLVDGDPDVVSEAKTRAKVIPMSDRHVFWCRCPECKDSKVGIVIK